MPFKGHLPFTRHFNPVLAGGWASQSGWERIALWELPLHSGRCVWFLQGGPEAVEPRDDQSGFVNPDATEILHVKRRKAPLF